MRILNRLYRIVRRELAIMWRNPIYGFCTVVFPAVTVLFFTSLMSEGQPTEMPVGVVDLDNTATSRSLVRTLDGMQTTHVVSHYQNMNEAQRAIQRNEIYAFLLIPKGTTEGLMTSSQPNISFYYSNISLVAGSLLYRDLKTAATLASASAGATKLAAIGKTGREINTFLQPIALDLHMISNPWSDYNAYLSTTLAPGVLCILVFLLTPYSLGTELKFGRARQWYKTAGENIHIALLGKMLPQTVIFSVMMLAFSLYVYYVLRFPHPGGLMPIILVSVLTVMACQGFGIFAFSIMPSLRMSMSVCSLWAVLSLSLSGATYPLFAMDSAIQGIAQLFPLRHYYMIYESAILNGFPLSDVWPHLAALAAFILLPVCGIRRLRRAMLTYTYIP